MPKGRHDGPVMGVQLRAQTRYLSDIASISYGRIPLDVLTTTLSSGRLASILLEQDIAAAFAITAGTQGAGPDLVDPQLGTIQVKTYRSTGQATYRSGEHAGQRKAANASIWTTKSGFWDRRKHLTPEQVAEAWAYLGSYDHFCYVNIADLPNLRYSFVVIPAAQVMDASDGFCISEDAINALVTHAVQLPGAATA